MRDYNVKHDWDIHSKWVWNKEIKWAIWMCQGNPQCLCDISRGLDRENDGKEHWILKRKIKLGPVREDNLNPITLTITK